MKKIILGLTALLLSSSLFAGGTVQDEITLTADGTGDFVVGQAYFANQDSWYTNIRVLNTNISATSIVKISFADGAESGDLLDFALYLTPGDVWEGILYYNPNEVNTETNCGGVMLFSADDSMVFASGTAKDIPQTICLGAGLRSQGATLNDKMGYIEVIGMAEISGTRTINGVQTDFSKAPVDKMSVYNAYYSYTQATEVQRETAMKSDGWTSTGNDSVGLFVDLINIDDQLSVSYRGVAFENFMGGRVVSNAVIAKDIVFNDYSDKSQTTLINELESAIQFNMVDFPYYSNVNGVNETVVIFTSITKRERYVDGTITDIWSEKSGITPGKSSDYCNQFVWRSRDMEENYLEAMSPVQEFSGGPAYLAEVFTTCTEMTYININDKVDYLNGMFSIMMFNNNRTIPAIPLILTVKEVQGVNVTDKVLPLYR